MFNIYFQNIQIAFIDTWQSFIIDSVNINVIFI